MGLGVNVKALLGLGSAGGLFGGLLSSGVLAAGEIYPKPYSVDYAELASMPIPPMAAGMAGGSDVTVEELPGRIAWHFRARGGEVATFTASLSEEDPWHTRVVVDFVTGEAMDSRTAQLVGTSFMRSNARIAMTEQVDARLTGRPFDQLRMGQMMAEHQQAHPEEIKEFGYAVGDMFNEVADATRAETAAVQASRPPPGQDREAMAAATRPMIDLPRQ
jgi:hypothetical protein